MKKIYYIFLSIIIFSLATIAYAEAATSQCNPFDDVDESYAYCEAIEFFKEKGIISGYSDSTFKPNNTINRAEFVKIISSFVYGNEAINECMLTTEDWKTFSDITINDWYAKFVCAAKSFKLVNGYSDGTFKPQNNINFTETSKILSIAFELKLNGDKEPWFKQYVDAVATKNAAPLSVDSFDQDMTRGEVTEMLYRLYKQDSSKASETYNSLAGDAAEINEPLLLTSDYEKIIEIFNADFVEYAKDYIDESYSLSSFEFVKDKRYFYVIYMDDDVNKKLLFSYDQDLANFEVEAYYKEGAESDFEKDEGTDNVSSLEKEIYILDSDGDIEDKTVLQEGYRYFESQSYKFRIQFPDDWYYASIGDKKYGFADKPLEAGNEIVTLSIVDGALDQYISLTQISDEKVVLFAKRSDKQTYKLETTGEYQKIAQVMINTIEGID